MLLLQLRFVARFPEVIAMKHLFSLACLAALAALQFPQAALAQRADYDALAVRLTETRGSGQDLHGDPP